MIIKRLYLYQCFTDLVLGFTSACTLLELLPLYYCDEDVYGDSWCHVTCNKSFAFLFGGGRNTVVIIGLSA